MGRAALDDAAQAFFYQPRATVVRGLAVEEKFENFLKGCGHDNVSVTLSLYGDDSMSNSTFSSYDNTEDLDDELQEDNVTQLNLNLQNKSYDETKPSDTE